MAKAQGLRPGSNDVSDLTLDSVQSALQAMHGREVVVIGDVGVDEYTLGQVRRISPEAPVPVVEVEKEEARLGLAANVAQNIRSLGGVARLVSVVGNDLAAEQLRGLLKSAGVDYEGLVVDPTRPTTRKLRVMVQNHHIVRVDYEQKKFIGSLVQNELLDRVQAVLERGKGRVAAVILQDYAKGVITEGLVGEVVSRAKHYGVKVLADPYRSTPLSVYRGVDLMTPNQDEAVALTGIGADELRASVETIDRVGEALMAGVGAQDMVITRGSKGMRLFTGDRHIDIPTRAKQVFDVTGAGDTVIAALALAWGSGLELAASCQIANAAAGVVVGKVGCVPCSGKELIDSISGD